MKAESGVWSSCGAGNPSCPLETGRIDPVEYTECYVETLGFTGHLGFLSALDCMSHMPQI